MAEEYRIRPMADGYGFAVGILLIDTKAPFIPGDVGNASTYPYPVLFRTVPGATVKRVLNEGDESLAEKVVSEACQLAHAGVRAIASDCGFMLRFQKAVAEAVDVPVILSSLLQLPMLEQTFPRERKIGVITANKKCLTDDLLQLSGLKERSRVVVCGMESQPYFRAPILDETGVLVPEKIEREVVSSAKRMVKEEPAVGPILLECSSLPPYAHAVQKATDRPVFDFITMINLFSAACFRLPYQGIY